jgi:hypothetical protein
VINFGNDRLMHRHGDQWVEMKPVSSSHSPDEQDPERRLIRGEQVYRCEGCDEEMQVVLKGAPG